ncbi:MAG: hypothetical protein JNJ80_20795 [Gemmatimonadetes bacterium]|nr:hypothetical protein [Gemmatimonadota bacterium]
MRRLLVVGLLGLAAATPASAQRVLWKNLVTVYGDNTEFFTPYREGETILGGQFASRLVVEPADQYAVHLGVFGDVRWGSEEFLDRVRPILAFRYRTAHSLGVIGTLETDRRHGFLDALAVSTQELTRPIEYGLQWIERRRWWEAEAFINWQALNTPAQREVFDFGGVARVRPVRQVTIEGQLHGLHHGGQLFSADVPVTNNAASALGIILADTLRPVGRVSLAAYRLRSTGNIDPDAPSDRPRRGRGTLLRIGVEPARGLEVFGLHWRGRDFLSQEGDNNYNSVGLDQDFYRARRKYLEIGVVRRGRLDGGVELDAEFRFHRIDDEPSIAIEGTSWEYSYRLVVRTPFQFLLR